MNDSGSCSGSLPPSVTGSGVSSGVVTVCGVAVGGWFTLPGTLTPQATGSPSFGQIFPVDHAPGSAVSVSTLLFSLGPDGVLPCAPQQWSRNLKAPEPSGLRTVIQ